MLRTPVCLGLVSLALLGGFAATNGNDNAPAAVKTPDVPREIAHWVRKLSDPDSVVRDEAVRKLVELGQPVIKPVATAAETGNLETITRCVSVLARLHKSTDAVVKQQASDALKKLADSPNKSLARRAQAIVGGRKPVAMNPRLILPGMIVQRAGNRRVTLRTINGETQVHAVDGPTEISIRKKPTGEIEMTVTKPDANGKELTSKYAAANLEELKANHDEAAVLYERYMNRQRVPGVNFAINARVAGGPAVPDPLEVARARQAVQDMTRAREAARKTVERLKDLSRGTDLKPSDLETLVRDLEAALDQIDESGRKVESLKPSGR